MLTDNGSELKNKEIQEVCDTLGLKHISLQCTHHSQTNAWKGGIGSLKPALQSTFVAVELNGMNWYHW